MSLTLIENPVETVDGIVNNLFAGFERVEFKFKREDAQISGISQGIDNQILINTLTDLSTYLEVGDIVYTNSVGLTYEYNVAAPIVAITSSTITIESDFIETSSDGYINFYRNYRLEVQLVNVDNSAIKVLPFQLIDDGDNAGNITIDVSIANDLNDVMFEYVQQEMTDSRVLFKVQYREAWDENLSGSYTLITDEIILVYATEQPEIEYFLNELDTPEIIKGYPVGVVFSHSSQNVSGSSIRFSYNELDLNQTDLGSNISLGEIDSTKEGFLFVNIDKDTAYSINTEYISIQGSYISVNFFDETFFDSTFFDTN